MRQPLAFFFTLVLVGFTLGCLMGCSSAVNAPSGKYYLVTGSMEPLASYKSLEIAAVKNETGQAIEESLLSQIFQVTQRTFLDSGLFHQVNGMTEPYEDAAHGELGVVSVVPSLVLMSNESNDSEVTVEYAFDDHNEGIRIATLQVLGRGGDVGLEAAIQSVGTGLSRALLTQVDRESVATQGSRGYY